MADFLTQAWPFAAAVLVVLGAIALVVLIVILIRAAKTMGHVSKLAEQAEAELTPTLKRIDPLVDRAELTVDTINLELLRVDSSRSPTLPARPPTPSTPSPPFPPRPLSRW